MKKSDGLPAPKHYLRTIADVLAVVNESNIDNFLVDFRDYLIQAPIHKKLLEEAVGKSSVGPPQMVWIDDGKTGWTGKVQIDGVLIDLKKFLDDLN